LNVRHGIGFVPQGHNVFRELSVEQNLRIAVPASRSCLCPNCFVTYFPF
jgi:ABC-type branched-subunit amino acid transport system ATPase component